MVTRFVYTPSDIGVYLRSVTDCWSMAQASLSSLTDGSNSGMVEAPKASVLTKRIKRGFYNTFVMGNGLRMILRGLGITLILTFLVSLLGSLLGALICRFRMSGTSYAEAFARIYVRLIQGIPVLVHLRTSVLFACLYRLDGSFIILRHP